MPTVVIDNKLPLLKEVIRNLYGRLQQSSGVAAQVEHQALQTLGIKAFQCFRELLICCFREVRDVDVADARPDLEGIIDAQAADLAARYGKIERFVIAFTSHE